MWHKLKIQSRPYNASTSHYCFLFYSSDCVRIITANSAVHQEDVERLAIRYHFYQRLVQSV